MKFYGHGIVWDKENDKALCQFENGVFETDDQRSVDLLKNLGFEHDEEPVKRKTTRKQGE